MVSSTKLIGLGLIVVGGGKIATTLGLTTGTKYCTTSRRSSSFTLPTKSNVGGGGGGGSLTSPPFNNNNSSSSRNKRATTTNTRAGGTGVYTNYFWQSNTLLTSSHVEARHISHHHHRRPSLSRLSQFVRRKGSERIILSVILTAILLFAPAFSPAARAASASASVGRVGISPYIPFSMQSRALGTFSFLPNKAEMELCFRLLYAACLGAFVGLERSSSECPAGVRTMALVGLGAATYTICSTHGFLPHTALGFPPGSPFLDSVKCDLSRMASNIASGVGFIGAGAIHKSTLRKDGNEAQNVVSGLTTASAIWVSAAVGIASAVGLYFSGAVATFATVAILKYARLPKYEVQRTSSSSSSSSVWEPKALVVEKDHEHNRPPQAPPRQRPVHLYDPRKDEYISGLFGDPTTQNGSIVDHNILERYSAVNRPIIIKEVIDPRFEQYLRSRLGMDSSEVVVGEAEVAQRESKVLIEEEQAVITSESEGGPTSTSSVVEP
jgi:putative Mg2+ transporter-C (MgtC) family protein